MGDIKITTAEKFIPKHDNGLYSRNQVISYAESYADQKLKNLITKHKQDLLRVYVKPFANEDGCLEQDLLSVLIDRFEQYYNENFKNT